MATSTGFQRGSVAEDEAEARPGAVRSVALAGIAVACLGLIALPAAVAAGAVALDGRFITLLASLAALGGALKVFAIAWAVGARTLARLRAAAVAVAVD